MLKKVLIANRGEIAIRIIRACRELGIKTVAVYSEADKTALHTKMADESICIGPAMPKKSYLNMKSIIEAACLTGCDGIHPGFGFLSENSSFAKICNEIGIKFIGPDSKFIDLMGNKIQAKDTMKKSGVPVVPGSEGKVETLESAKRVALEVGYPIMLKASAGGGGKGIRIIFSEEELMKTYEITKTEAKNSFNDDTLYIEKFIENPRHVEIQIMADEHGAVVSLGERDCSIQRNNQKVIEETPSMAIDDNLRKKMEKVSVKAIKDIGYTNVGTIEYLVDKYKNFYFMEMNTRIQVEHPVTEMVTGIDIVKEQLRISSGEALRFKQEDICFKGHSIECRINAENPAKNFMPCPGKITDLHLPGGNNVRVETAIYEDYVVPGNYDSMIAKVIVLGDTRKEAISKMKTALSEFIIKGIDTNIQFLCEILENKSFNSNDYDTSFVKKEFGSEKK